jgi:3-oxoacyl-[acyl-carrier protein] reductase
MTLQDNILCSKNVFITGATGGLGRALAIEYAKKECNLFLTGRCSFKLSELKKEIDNFIDKEIDIQCRACDLRDESALYSLIKFAKDTFGHIDILINCAGTFSVKSIEETTIEQYKECINLNLTVPFVLIKEFSKEMVFNKWGQIINIASSSAYGGAPNTSIYCASKHGLLGLSRSLYKELNPYNVRVICVSPGSIKTSMGREVEKLGQDFDTFIEPTEVAKYVVCNSSFNGNMISEEIRLNRMFIQ